MDALHENIAQYTHSGSKPCNMAAAGEYVVGISFEYRANSNKAKGSPIDLAKERTKVFGRRGKIVLLSSPKSDDDLIVTHHAQVEDRRVFAVPCSACGRSWDASSTTPMTSSRAHIRSSSSRAPFGRTVSAAALTSSGRRSRSIVIR